MDSPEVGDGVADPPAGAATGDELADALSGLAVGTGPARVTAYFVTVNTNRSIARMDETAAQQLVDQFAEYMDDVVLSRDELPRLLGARAEDLVDIQVVSQAVEIGARDSKVHWHGTLVISHRTRLNMHRQRHWQEFIRHTAPFYTSPYVNIALLDTRAENYALKQQG